MFALFWCPRRRPLMPRPAPRPAGAARPRGSLWEWHRGSGFRPSAEVRSEHPEHGPRRRSRPRRGQFEQPRCTAKRPNAALERRRAENDPPPVDAHDRQWPGHPGKQGGSSPEQRSPRPRKRYEAASPVGPKKQESNRSRGPSRCRQFDLGGATGTLHVHAEGKAPQAESSPQEGESRPSPQRGPRPLAASSPASPHTRARYRRARASTTRQTRSRAPQGPQN